MAVLKGIDVSAWQGIIDWEKVKAAGIKFAILKAGGSDDDVYTDSKFERNYSECKRLGIPVGAYWFVGKGCITSADGTADAERFIKLLKGKTFEYPAYMDCEVTPVSQKKGATDAAIAFCKALEKAGYYAGIYGSTYSTFQSRLDDSRLLGYAHWVAQYASSCQYWDSYGIWQYSSDGYVAGIVGRTDMNLCYVDYPAIIKAKGLNGFKKASTSSDKAKTTAKTNKYKPLTVDGLFGVQSVKMEQTMLNAELGLNMPVDGVEGIVTNKARQQFINKWIAKQNQK